MAEQRATPVTTAFGRKIDMWKCKKCGEKHEDVFDSCWKCGTKLDPGTAAPKNETVSEDAEENAIAFACIVCGRQLRITFPINTGRYSCPACKTHYQSVKVSEDPYVFVLVPKTETKATEDEPPPPKRRRVIPKEVKLALALFDLTESTSFEEVKRAYRNAVQSYHPDKVAHLGSELKKVAEHKTKEFVAAFDQIKKFYADNEE